MITLGDPSKFIRQSLLELKVDDTVRFPIFHRTTVFAQMRDLKEFGEAGNKYLYTSVPHHEAGDVIVVRLK